MTTIADLVVLSPDFADGARLEDRFTADGGNHAPRLIVTGTPTGTIELALIMDDPDAPRPDGFVHWVRYGIPPTTSFVDKAGRTGPNDRGTFEYFGPRPPAGHGIHRYYFWVYALDATVEGLPSRREFLERYGPHVLEQNRIVGTYERTITS